jgi:hypothetical protein
MRYWLILAGLLAIVTTALGAGDSGVKSGTLKVDTPGMVVGVKPAPGKITTKRDEIRIAYGREVKAPTGRYEVGSVEIFAKNEKGEVWSLRSGKELGKLASVTVLEDTPTTLAGGLPLKVKTAVTIDEVDHGSDVRPENSGKYMDSSGMPIFRKQVDGKVTEGKGDKIVRVAVNYVGASGESYLARPWVNNKAGPPPVIRIVTQEDGKDKVLSEGPYKSSSAEGLSDSGKLIHSPEGYPWRVPHGWKGKYKVVVALNLGPFKAQEEEEVWHTIE